jgi:hypothetical protein
VQGVIAARKRMHEEKVRNSRDDFPALGDSAVCAVGTLNAAAPPAKRSDLFAREENKL